MFRTKLAKSLLIGAVVATVLAGGAVATTSIASAETEALSVTFDTDEVLVTGTLTWLSDEEVKVNLTTTPRAVSRIYINVVAWEPGPYGGTGGVHDHQAYYATQPDEQRVTRVVAGNPNLLVPEIGMVRVLAYSADPTIDWDPIEIADCYREETSCRYNPFGEE
jgi:hypothetical protein